MNKVESVINTLPLVIQREGSLMEIVDNDKKLKNLNRCFILRAVSTVYLYLISSSFLIALFITIPVLVCLKWWIFGFSVEIMVFAVLNYFLGYDNAIAGYFNDEKNKKFKWLFNIFRWSTFVIIGITFILLIFELYAISLV